jgi:hypothetical protein
MAAMAALRHCGVGSSSMALAEVTVAVAVWRAAQRRQGRGGEGCAGYGLVVFIVYKLIPLEYVETIMWLEKLLTGLKNLLTPVFFPLGGDGSNELESVP